MNKRETMGYSGLEHYLDSDSASDAASVMMDAMVKVLEEKFKEEENKWNTPGFLNVALIVEALILPHPEEYGNHEGMCKIITNVDNSLMLLQISLLEDEDKNRDIIKATRRIIAACTLFLPNKYE